MAQVRLSQAAPSCRRLPDLGAVFKVEVTSTVLRRAM